MSLLFFIIFSLLSFLLQPVSCHQNRPAKSPLRSKHHSHSHPTSETSPITYFEVTKPIELPKTKPCSYLLLQHDFANSYHKPPVLADYSPPSDCPGQDFSKVVLEFKATSKGRQFDRIFGVWLSGVEILRSCTAEPGRSGIVWTVQKDITKYSSLLKSNQTLAVYMGNIVDDTYTGIYHVNISMHFYPAEEESLDLGNLGFDSEADLILPISRNLPLNDGLWFEIQNSSDVQFKEFKIPQNAYRVVLEVYVSFHEKDEFWYTNLPDEYINANNVTGVSGNGPFREIIVSLDDKVVGAVWPFTVVFTGGINPLMWIPITGIGSFDLPSYNIEVTPFLGQILDGHTHRFGFRVTNALNVWYVNANLHVWLDAKSAKTEGKLLSYDASPLMVSSTMDFSGYDGSFVTNVKRSVSSVGLINSSFGAITTRASQGFNYTNSVVLMNEGNTQIVDQIIESGDEVSADIPFSSSYLFQSMKRFPIFLKTSQVDKGNKTYESLTEISLGFNEKKTKVSDSGNSVSNLENLQKALGNTVVKNQNVVQGSGSTQQTYSYLTGESCYFREARSSNYTIEFDKISNACNNIAMVN